MFESNRLSHRLLLLVIIAIIGLVTLGGTSLWLLRSSLEAAEQRRINDIVDSTTATLDYFYALEQSGKLSRTDAQKEALAVLRKTRFEQGKNYIFINGPDGSVVLSPLKPESEGTNMLGKKTADGVLLWDEMTAAIKKGEARMIPYKWPRVANGDPEQKYSWIRPYAPWGWAVGTGIYLTAVDEAYRSGLAWTAVIGIILLSLIAGVSWMVVRSVIQQLGGEPGYAVRAMRALAQGDLTTNVRNLGRADSLLGTLGQTIIQLRSMLSEIATNAESVAKHSQSVSSATRDIASASTKQSESTSSIAAAIEEMTVSVNHISDSAQNSSDNALKGVAATHEGEALASDAALEMRKTATSVGEAATKIRDLVDRANEIGTIANVIKDIAAQTNLLALNAAIEAARAGESGRGFAVVADEVRKLAERTSNATVQIEQMLKGIQDDTHLAVEVMNDVAIQVKNGVGQVQAVADTLHVVQTEATNALGASRAIAEGTREQVTASTLVAQQVEQISLSVETTTESMRSAATAVESLEKLAENLHRMTARFKY
ncbi:methyl-accepting chemotaxis protein [Propionivibrio dicarboxylicus]|uniref:Methyl-accepting chemotaxis protein n=1 Tax=Propionivibrio dicarboxylicus TaxID=83767 RepID=A0A1G8ANH7_9RHOO|nr:methyl-accepting chemotaxis protein [Propionivibrio dicarboxylicus]SDH22439.1 methyl-accepting chemotaxis protein [Propionivibrio dicarboxylicus]